MKSFKQFMTELAVYSVRQSGEGGRVYRKRKKSETETRRMKADWWERCSSHIKIVKILEHRRRERQENNNQQKNYL